MDLRKMIAELQSEKQRLDRAIEALERLSSRNPPRRGRPPSWLKEQIEGLTGSEESAETKNTAT
jgi:sugar-specific transcriptional regulator TrmB